MMKYITILFLFIAQISFSQSKPLSKIIDKIDYQNDTILAVFNWVTDNIKYDVGKLKKLEKGVNFYKKGNYKSTKEFKAAMLKKVIKGKKGVCEDYTLLFNSIVNELGYISYVIPGVTKGKNDKVRKSSSHSWIAIKVDGVWKLYDPTWGAGYVNDKKKFVKKYFSQWYDVEPEKMKEKHFPFDPIWQLSENPMTYEDFKKGGQTKKPEISFDYTGMIEEYLEKDEKEQILDALNRSELNGGNIQSIKKHRKHLQKKISFYESSNRSSVIKSTLDNNRNSSQLFVEYIKAKNNRFKDKKWTIEYSKNTLLDIQNQLEQSIETFKKMEANDAKSKRAIKGLLKQSNDFHSRVSKELEYLDDKF